MKRSLVLAAATMMLAMPALAQTPAGQNPAVANVPAQSMAISDWYRQSVYDMSNTKIGDINDILFDQQHKAAFAIVGVGGFLGIGEKSVAVPFDTIKRTVRDGKIYLTMDANKDALKTAPGLRYDRVTNTWGPDTAQNTAPGGTNTNTNSGMPGTVKQ